MLGVAFMGDVGGCKGLAPSIGGPGAKELDPPPTKLSSSALAIGAGDRVAVMPKLSATLKLVDPPENRGLLKGFFAIISLFCMFLL